MKKLSGIYQKFNKREWFEPVFIIGMSLTITLGIVVGVHSVMGQEEITIADNQAEEYFYEGKYDKAIEEFTKIQQKDEWPIWKVKLAEIYSIKGEVDKSNMLLKEAVIIRNKLLQNSKDKYIDEDKVFMNEVIFDFFMNKEYDQALSLGEDYIINNEQYKPLMRTMLAIYRTVGEKENAKDIVAQYKVDENSAYDMSVYANMQMVVGNVKEALITLKNAFELDKDEISVLDVVGQLATYNKEEVLDCLTELSEGNDKAYDVLLAKVYTMDEESYNLASSLLNSLDESLKQSLTYSVLKAQFLYETDREEEAKEIIDNIINSKDKGYGQYCIEAEKYLKEGQYDKALEYCKKSIIENKDYADNYGMLLPKILIAKNDIASIDSYFRTALLKEPFNTNMIINIGNYYSNKALQYDKAIEYYKLASNMKEDDAEIYYFLGNMEVNKEMEENAVEYFKKAIDLDSNNGRYFRALGTIYYVLGENEKSIENTREAFMLDEKDILALNNAGCYYISVEKDVWRGFSNIEAAYEEMPEDIDEDIKRKITDNYNKAKSIFDVYIENEDMDIKTPQFELFY